MPTSVLQFRTRTQAFLMAAGLAVLVSVFQDAFSQTTMLGGTNATAIKVLTYGGGTVFTDTTSKLTYSSATSVYNLVGDASSPLLQYQNGNVGTGSGDQYGIIFRVRLGGYSLSSLSTGNELTVQVGIGVNGGGQKATFAVGATISSSSSSVFVADAGGSFSQGNDPSSWIDANNKWAQVTTIAGTNSAVTYQQTTDTNASFNSGTDTQDAWLTFGASFAAVRGAAATNSTSGILNFTTNSGTNYDVSLATFKGATTTNWAVQDFLASGTNAQTALFSDPLPITSAAIPEPATYLFIATTLPFGLMVWSRRRKNGVS